MSKYVEFRCDECNQPIGRVGWGEYMPYVICLTCTAPDENPPNEEKEDDDS